MKLFDPHNVAEAECEDACDGLDFELERLICEFSVCKRR
jgi:hypothetical protein